jgi:hypothetical protein
MEEIQSEIKWYIREKTLMYQFEVFRVVTPCSVVVGYQRFRSPFCLHLEGELAGMGVNGIDIGRGWRGADIRNVGILPQNYTPSQPG